MVSFPRDDNRVAVIGGVSSVDGVSPVVPYVDPTTHRLLVNGVGIQGTQGTQGSIGPAGATGATGANGNQGSQGTQGSLGPTGAQGATGNPGAQGTQGTQGSLGPTGATGSQGPQGTQGTQGSLGPTGPQGTQGSIGIQGPQGTQGSLGVTGPQGTQGTQGSVGVTGATGSYADAFKWNFSGPTAMTAPTNGNIRLNATGFSNTTQLAVSEINTDGITLVTWLSNVATSTSANKAILYMVKSTDPTVFSVYLVTSLTDNGSWDTINVTYVNSNGTFVSGDIAYITFSIIGNQGAQGTQGSIGLQGTQGTQGSLGPTGATGSQGLQGTQGTQGSPGTTGSQGPQGTQGTQGSLGPTGATGPQGPQGTQGTQGSLGPTGATGSQGAQGTQGTQGSQGGTGYVAPRVTATGSTLSPNPNADTTDIFQLTAQAGTAAFTGPAGTPLNGQKMQIEVLATGSDRNITWGAGYTAGPIALPSVATLAKKLTVGFEYDTSNSLNAWLCIASTVATPGATGPTGAQGATGPQGTQGTQGSLGPTGATGAQGTQGSIGLQGTQGTQGSIGPTGFVSPRVTSTGSTLSPTPNADTTDVYKLTAQAGTAAFTGPAGSPLDGQLMRIEILATGATRNITWGANFTAGGVALPLTASVGKKVTVGFEYDTANSANDWMCIASSTQL